MSLDDCKKANPTFEQLLKSRVQSKARVLEVGCGTSTLAAQLFDMGFHDVTGGFACGCVARIADAETQAIDYVDAAIRAQKERQVCLAFAGAQPWGRPLTEQLRLERGAKSSTRSTTCAS